MFTYTRMKSLKLSAVYFSLAIALSGCYCLPLLENCGYELGKNNQQEENSTSYHLASGKEKKKSFIKGIPTLEAGASINFKTGDNASTPYGTYKSNPGIGFSFTVGREMYLSRELLFHPSIGIKNTRVGDETSVYVPGDDFTFSLKNTYRFSHITAPVMMEYRVLDGQLGFFGGPALNFLLNARQKSSESDSDRDIASDTRKVGLDGQVGVSYTPRMYKGWIGRVSGKVKYDQRFGGVNKIINGGSRFGFRGVSISLIYRVY